MGKKLTIDFVKSEFEKEGWVCVSKEYINAHSKLKYICSKKHSGLIRWSGWQQGDRCPICSGKKKHTIDFVKAEFEKEGWTCVSTVYIGVHSKLDYICSNKHTGVLTWANWSQGFRCPIGAGNKKHTIEFIKLGFEKAGYILSAKKYINSYSKLEYICPKGHSWAITWDSWKKGKRCSICANIDNSIRFSGENHWNWKGGISCEPYCQDWTKEFKEYIKERDDYKCLNPYCNSKNSGDLTVHHIDYNKKLCGPENLITICRSCNAKANFYRNWHKAWYKAVLYRRYNII